MKRLSILLFLSALLVLLLLSCENTGKPAESTASPDSGISTGPVTEPVDYNAPPKIAFSRGAGFYDEPFDLTVAASYGTIHYTTDGSTPTEKSPVYSGPIHIADASENDNVWSMRDDISTAFLKDLCVEWSGWEPGYQLPDTKMDKCTLIRAVAIGENGLVSEVITGSYFVGFQNKLGYENIGIVSLMTEPDNLFNARGGIYVRGVTFDNYLKQRKKGATQWTDPYWWWWPCNYNQKGSIECERPATVQFFDPERRVLLTKDIGIRIQGGGSRGKIPRSFNFYSRADYDGTNKFGFTPFTSTFDPQRVTLFAGGDQNVSKLNDWLMATLMPDRNFSTMEFSPYALFLEGEYWGMYFLTEKYDEEYIHYHYNVKKDDVIIVKNSKIEEGESKDLVLYQDMVSWISNNDMTNSTNYAKACEMIDIESYIDYYAAEIYIGRYNDWPGGNFALWRSRSTAKTGEYDDGRWRWMLFDVNSGAMEKSHVKTETVTDIINGDRMFRHLMRNSTFKKKFARRILDMANKEFLPSHVDEVLDSYRALMMGPMEKEFERFYASGNTMMATWNEQVDKVQYFFDNRYQYIVNYFTPLK